MIRDSKGEHQFRLYDWMAVVLWADAAPMIGMLMIPKTCATCRRCSSDISR